MADPYHILGVSKSATADEIKSAYRKLAKKLHPDVNPGRKDIEQKFKDVTAAYDLLSDAEKRARFDRGEIDGQGQERGFSGFGGGGRGRTHGSYRSSGAAGDPFSAFGDVGGMEDIFAEFMGARGKRGAANLKGADVTYSLAVPFTEACLGGKRRVTLSSGKTIDVSIPIGSKEGDKLRLRGQGEQGPMSSGDAIIEIHVEPHQFLTRDGNNINLEAPISLPEAVSGASMNVPTLDGQVTVKVPKGANSGTTLRLKGKGIPAKTPGDMFVKLKIVLPDPLPDDLTEVIEKWAKKHAYDPRKRLGW